MLVLISALARAPLPPLRFVIGGRHVVKIRSHQTTNKHWIRVVIFVRRSVHASIDPGTASSCPSYPRVGPVNDEPGLVYFYIRVIVLHVVSPDGRPSPQAQTTARRPDQCRPGRELHSLCLALTLQPHCRNAIHMTTLQPAGFGIVHAYRGLTGVGGVGVQVFLGLDRVRGVFFEQVTRPGVSLSEVAVTTVDAADTHFSVPSNLFAARNSNKSSTRCIISASAAELLVPGVLPETTTPHFLLGNITT